MGHSKASQTRLLALENQNKALELKIAGATYDQIARALKVSKKTAWTYVQKALEERKRQRLVNTDQYVEVELARLERLFAAVWPNAVKGDLKHIDRAIRISQERRTLLGLDQVVQLNQDGNEGMDVDNPDAVQALLDAIPVEWLEQSVIRRKR